MKKIVVATAIALAIGYFGGQAWTLFEGSEKAQDIAARLLAQRCEMDVDARHDLAVSLNARLNRYAPGAAITLHCPTVSAHPVD